MYFIYFIFGPTAPQWSMASSFTRFLDHTLRPITVGRTPLDEWSALRRDLYLKTHSTHNRRTSMSPVGFETTVSAGEWPLGPAVYFKSTYNYIIVKFAKCVIFGHFIHPRWHYRPTLQYLSHWEYTAALPEEGYGEFPLVHAATWKHTAFINHSQLRCALRGFLDKSEFGNTTVQGTVQPSSSPVYIFTC